MNLKEFVVRNKGKVLLVSGVVAAAIVVTVVAVSIGKDDVPCSEYAGLNGTMETGWLGNSVSASSGAGDMQYELSGWSGIPAEEKHCQCKLELSSIQFDAPAAAGTAWIGTNVIATFHIVNGANSTTRTIPLTLAPTVAVGGPGIYIYEGTSLTLTLANSGTSTGLPTGLRVNCGGLCIVEEVEGGDDRRVRAKLFDN